MKKRSRDSIPGGMNRSLWFIALFMGLALFQCRAVKELQKPVVHEIKGMEGLEVQCAAVDTIQSFVISKAEAILIFDDERYEVTLTLYSVKDSIIYLSAVNSGYEMLRASVMHDSIKVINRLNRIVYRAPLERRFGYQYPVNFRDLQNLISRYYLCDDLGIARDDMEQQVHFEFDEEYVKKRIYLDRDRLQLDKFEFYHQRTDAYLMGERVENGFKVYSNFMITEFEIVARGGTLTYNREIEIQMDVNPRKYTFTELR